MKKKTYKQMQNRLYREIKRRIIAENRWIKEPIAVAVCERKIETIELDDMIPNRYIREDPKFSDFIKQDMARRIVNRLIAEGYISFYSYERDPALAITDCSRIKARLNVAKPYDIYLNVKEEEQNYE